MFSCLFSLNVTEYFFWQETKEFKCKLSRTLWKHLLHVIYVFNLFWTFFMRLFISIWFCREQKLGDIMEMTFGGRYVIMMMALFSIYTGLIYNEFFSVPFELFGSSAYGCRDSTCRYWICTSNLLHHLSSFSTILKIISLLYHRDDSTVGLIKVRDTYPFGVDPKWHGSRSELPFLNSLKMKMSILLGVAQMNLGIVLSYYNAKFFGNNLNIW